MNGVVSYSAPNFVRRDELRQWLSSFLPDKTADRVLLMVWRLSPSLMVTHSKERVLLEPDNWSKVFRSRWKRSDEFKVPDLGAPEPQPD